MKARTRMAAVVLAAVISVVLAGCDNVDSGTITGKHHVGSMVIPAGKVMVIQPERWVLELRNCDTDPCKTGEENVSESEYKRAKIGDRYGDR